MPETLGGAPVRSYGLGALYGLPLGGSLTLPSGITNLKEGEFNSSPLSSITFLGPIKAIPNGAFFGCSELTRVSYPDTVTSIGDDAFSGCRRLKDISLPAGLTKIGANAFWFCASLKTNQPGLTIPATVTTIGTSAFSGCTSLAAIEVDPLNSVFSSVDGVLLNKNQSTLLVCPAAKAGTFTIPETVTLIRASAFARCKNLTGVKIPQNITTLFSDTFGGCIGLTNILLPSGLTTLGTGVFAGTGLSVVDLPATITRIPESTYSGCPNLTNITLSDHITAIGANAFGDCPNVTRFTIPKSVISLGSQVVTGARLTEITVDELNPVFSSVDGVVFNKARTTLLLYPTGKSGDYQVPDGVRTIGTDACSGAVFASVTIPASVTSLQGRAFAECDQLATLEIPDTVSSMGIECFSGCDRLASVRVGKGITTIPSNAFSSCPLLSEVKLPDTLRTIAASAFFGCPSLHRLTIPASVRSLQGSSLFDHFIYDGTQFLELFFEGNAPSAERQALVFAPESKDLRLTVYHRPGTTGWQETFAGRPAVLWDPQVATGDGGPGIRNGKFGFSITGAPGMTVAVEACTDLANPVWVRLGTQVLTDGKSPFVDADGVNQLSRFYRFQFP